MVNLKNWAPSKYFLVSKNFSVKCKGGGNGGWEGGGWMGRRFGEKRSKNYFCDNRGSKYFSDLFRPQFSEHVAQFQHSGAPSGTSGKVGPPFKLTFFWTEYCLCSRCIIQKCRLDKCNWNWTKSICQITRNHKQPYKREEIYRGKSLHVA
jgi:hypothetical protein